MIALMLQHPLVLTMLLIANAGIFFLTIRFFGNHNLFEKVTGNGILFFASLIQASLLFIEVVCTNVFYGNLSLLYLTAIPIGLTIPLYLLLILSGNPNITDKARNQIIIANIASGMAMVVGIIFKVLS